MGGAEATAAAGAVWPVKKESWYAGAAGSSGVGAGAFNYGVSTQAHGGGTGLRGAEAETGEGGRDEGLVARSWRVR